MATTGSGFTVSDSPSHPFVVLTICFVVHESIGHHQPPARYASPCQIRRHRPTGARSSGPIHLSLLICRTAHRAGVFPLASWNGRCSLPPPMKQHSGGRCAVPCSTWPWLPSRAPLPSWPRENGRCAAVLSMCGSDTNHEQEADGASVVCLQYTPVTKNDAAQKVQ